MKNTVFNAFIALVMLFSFNAMADIWAEGVPVTIQKTDYSSMHLIYIQFDKPVVSTGCSSSAGVVVLDSNESAKAALTFALTAQASGKKFRCYVVTNQCSGITGAVDTFPVCGYYPSLVN